MTAYFITGTDTDCGKTYVTCQLLDYFNQEGKQALALKPVASGCSENESQDALDLQKHNCDNSYVINGWRFAPAIAPHLAASAAKVNLSAAKIADFCLQAQFAAFDPLLIEGAGGLMVPLNEEETWLDFLELTKIPVILVVAMRLGCINHALLTKTVLQAKQIKTQGWIANCLDETMLELDANIATLVQKMEMPLLGVLRYNSCFYGQGKGSVNGAFMPIYEYECKNCQHHFDLIQKISDQPVKQCPQCLEHTAVRLVSAAGFQLKGSGWYATDFKNKGKPEPKSTEKTKPTDSKTETASETPKSSRTETSSKKGETE